MKLNDTLWKISGSFEDGQFTTSVTKCRIVGPIMPGESPDDTDLINRQIEIEEESGKSYTIRVHCGHTEKDMEKPYSYFVFARTDTNHVIETYKRNIRNAISRELQIDIAIGSWMIMKQ